MEMPMICVDTDVMVDMIRRYTPAVAWLRSLGSETLCVPGLVAMELLQGCRNRAEQQRVEETLRPYKLYWPEPADCERAFQDYATYHLSHQLGIINALIAETVVGLGAIGTHKQPGPAVPSRPMVGKINLPFF